jgi:isopropylmalate/homocitrate/citramalate synthase
VDLGRRATEERPGDQLCEIPRHARGVFPYDTTRAREEDLSNVLTRIMQEAPPDAVGVVDTMGCILPEA